MKSNYLMKTANCKFALLFCVVLVVAITVNAYSQNAEPNLKVVISTGSGSSEREMKVKDNFKVGEAVQLKVEIANLSNEVTNIPKGIDYSRPTLFHNGKLVSYRKEIIERFEKRKYRVLTGMLSPKPNESQSEILDLSDFYELLEPGQYQLSLERHFFKESDNPIRIQSNAVTFEVISCGKK